jgi:hypothetical protein
MTWHKHVVPGERGPLSVWYSSGNAEIVPMCVANAGKTNIQYELTVAGKERGMHTSLKKAKSACVEIL